MQVVTLTHRLSHSPHSLAHSLIHPLTHSHYCSVQLHELTVIVMALFFFCFLILHSLGDLICALLLYTTDTIPVDTRYGGSWAWVCEWAKWWAGQLSERQWMNEHTFQWGEWDSRWVSVTTCINQANVPFRLYSNLNLSNMPKNIIKNDSSFKFNMIAQANFFVQLSNFLWTGLSISYLILVFSEWRYV